IDLCQEIANPSKQKVFPTPQRPIRAYVEPFGDPPGGRSVSNVQHSSEFDSCPTGAHVWLTWPAGPVRNHSPTPFPHSLIASSSSYPSAISPLSFLPSQSVESRSHLPSSAAQSGRNWSLVAGLLSMEPICSYSLEMARIPPSMTLIAEQEGVRATKSTRLARWLGSEGVDRLVWTRLEPEVMFGQETRVLVTGLPFASNLVFRVIAHTQPEASSVKRSSDPTILALSSTPASPVTLVTTTSSRPCLSPSGLKVHVHISGCEKPQFICEKEVVKPNIVKQSWRSFKSVAHTTAPAQLFLSVEWDVGSSITYLVCLSVLIMVFIFYLR
ncbi:unnamed protein product, partial [Protopolystoma xenopodis]